MNVTFQELVQHVCKRPTMYTVGGTFREAVAFLFGYHSARLASEAELVDMSAFSAWLSQKTGSAQNEFWWSQLSRAYPDDAEAFRQLPILFIEFMGRQE